MYQNTNPAQRSRLRPNWMKISVENSLDVVRYKKFAIDLNQDQDGVFNMRKSLQVKRNLQNNKLFRSKADNPGDASEVDSATSGRLLMKNSLD